MTNGNDVSKLLGGLNPSDRKLIEALVQQMSNRADAPSQKLANLTEGIPIWVASLKQERYAPRTIEMYVLLVNAFLKVDPDPTKLSIQQWMANRLEQVSATHVRNSFKALRSFFSFLYAEGLWPSNPLENLKPVPVKWKTKDCPDVDTINKLLESDGGNKKHTPKYHMMLLLLVTTGLRVSEAAKVQRKDINWQRAELKVIGKGDKEGIVPLQQGTLDALSAYIQTYVPKDSEYIFPSDNKSGFWDVHCFEKSLRRACDRLEIKRVTPHALRHFFATYALRNGAKLEVVSRILRHASVGITADIYRHVDSEELHTTMDQFGPLGSNWNKEKEGTTAAAQGV